MVSLLINFQLFQATNTTYIHMYVHILCKHITYVQYHFCILYYKNCFKFWFLNCVMFSVSVLTPPPLTATMTAVVHQTPPPAVQRVTRARKRWQVKTTMIQELTLVRREQILAKKMMSQYWKQQTFLIIYQVIHIHV